MAELKKYAEADWIQFPLIDYGDTDFEDTPPTFEEGDCKISIDGASFANTTNLPQHIGQGTFGIYLTATEHTGKKMFLIIKDQSLTPLWEDQGVNIETYGDDDAQHL